MQAGKFRTRITIYRRIEDTSAPNASGEPPTTWEVLCACWSRKIEQGGKELYRALQTYPETQLLYEIRKQPGITFRRTDRIHEGDADSTMLTEPTIDVLGIIDPDEGRGRRLRFAAREFAA